MGDTFFFCILRSAMNKGIYCTLFLLCYVFLSCSAKKYSLTQQKSKPYKFEGEADDAAAMRAMFKIKDVDYELIELSGKELRKKVKESLLGTLPILEVQEGEETIVIPYYRTAERYLAKELDLFPKHWEEEIEVVLEVIDSCWARFLFSDATADGHNRWLLLSNFEKDWFSSAMKHIAKLKKGESIFLFETLSI